MSSVWTVERVLSLAPDASSAKAGQDLASPRKWVTLAQDGSSVWGECQGSGKNPYQTQIDLSEPAFKCSCPSRKFPCKHALALFILYAQDSRTFSQSPTPPWVTDWLSSRAKRAEQREARSEARAQESADPAAQAKRVASRESKVAAGMQDLELWLCDLVRQGLAAAQSKPYSFWEAVAARMVDSQAPGVARAVKNLADAANSGDGWQERLLQGMSRLQLLIEAYKRIETLPEPTKCDVRSLIGWTQDQDEMLNTTGLIDTWLVVGERVYEEDRLRVQRSWLAGCNSRRFAVVLNFTHLSQPQVDAGLVPGTLFNGELVFFAGACPFRALVKSRASTNMEQSGLPAHLSAEQMLQSYSSALGLNPWLTEFPAAIAEVTPVKQGDRWLVRDSEGRSIPVVPHYRRGWQLLSISGGHPMWLFGEWNGEWLLPMSTLAEGRLILVHGGNEG